MHFTIKIKQLSSGTMLDRRNATIKIGDFSYFQNRVLGKGATGWVFEGFRNKDMMPVAVKTIRLIDIDTPVKRHLLDCEVSALQSIKQHKYVCCAFDILKDEQFYFVPMEVCSNGTLRAYIKSKRRLAEPEALSLFRKILEGYSAIREAGFIHRDLKTENILLRSNMEPAIIDFGYCEKLETQQQRLGYNVGSPAYMSPEAYNDSFYSEKSDVWALGVILHQMLTGTIPVMRITEPNRYFKELAKMKTAEIIPGYQNPLCTQLLLSALTVNQNNRPTANQLLGIMVNQTPISPERKRVNSMRTEQRPKQLFNQKPQALYQNHGQPSIQSNSPLRHRPKTHMPIQSNSVQRVSTDSSLNVEANSPTLSPQLKKSPQGFTHLRKKALNPNFKIELTPVRNQVINPQEVRLSPKKSLNNSSSAAKLLPIWAEGSSPQRIRRNYSANNFSLSARFT